jgi:hypothetical protein
LALAPLLGGHWSIKTIEPVVLRRNGRLLQPAELSFREWVVAIVRRLTELTSLYGTIEPNNELDQSSLFAAADSVKLGVRDYRIISRQRFSKRQGQSHPLTGISGSFEVDGDLEPFGPLFRLGELFHIGKSIAFGLGQFEVEALSDPPQGEP